MSRASLIAGVHPFIGYPVNNHIDAIKAIAARNHYSVLIMDPDAPRNIDRDESRLLVNQDGDGNIISYDIG